MERLSLLIGWPSPKLLPAAAISKAAQSALADPDVFTTGLMYGDDEGYLPLRHALASWLGEFYQRDDLTYDRFTITGGASQNIGCILQVFTDPAYTQDVLMVAPSYMMIYPTFRDNGFEGRLVAVPEDDEGLDVGYLRNRLIESEEKSNASGNEDKLYKPVRPYSKYYRHIIYCVPTFSNPSSRLMSLSRRTSLVLLAREFDCLIISDDVYDHLQWPATSASTSTTMVPHTPLTAAARPRLVDLDKTLHGGPTRSGASGFGNVISNGSFSKICGPGVRCGWAESSPKFAYGLSQCGTTTSGGAPSQMTSTFMTKMLQDGVLQEHIFGTLQPAYARRYSRLIGAVEKWLVSLGVQLPQAERDIVGGYFVWLQLPGKLDASEYARRCREDARVPLLPGEKFEIPGDGRVKFPHHVRLCFSWIEEDLIEEAVKKIANVLKKMLAERGAM